MRKQSKSVHFRLSDHEREKLEQIAMETGQTISEVIRNLIREKIDATPEKGLA